VTLIYVAIRHRFRTVQTLVGPARRRPIWIWQARGRSVL